jgi:capsular polysaccharide biosynthesis protein
MVRDYDLERQHYADLTSKLHSATISESVERTGVSEQFTLLYPAAFPTVPTKPVPLRVMLLSLASGLAVGVGLTLLREYLDRSVRDVRALRNEFDVPVLGEIARIHPR